MMESLTERLFSADVIPIVVGTLLLLFGRKLYWLALGALGFFLGLTLAERNLEASGQTELIVAGVAGVAGVVFAYVAEKLAVTLGGFAIGAVLAYYLAQPYAEQLSYQIWFVVLVGALLGICFAAFVFKAAVIVVSALVGALLVTRGLLLEPPYEMAVFAALALVGIAIQTWTGRKAPDAD